MFLLSINGRPICNPYFKHCDKGILCWVYFVILLVKMVFIPYSQIDVENIQHLAPDIAGRLVRRPEDLPDEIKQSIALYKSNVLIPLEVCHLL